VPGYDVLRDQIEGLLTEARVQSRQARDWARVESYWHIGDALARHIDAGQGSTYGQQVVHNLSKDLKLARSTLYEIVLFRRTVADPNVYARRHFGWSHFRALIHLPGADAFERYARLAAEHGWTTRQLKRAIESGGDLTDDADLPAPRLRPRFGEPFTYRVVADRFDPDQPPAIDFGFSHLWVPGDDLPGFVGAGPGDRVTLEPARSGLRARVRADRPGLWTYPARLLRVVDGDTLDAVVDLQLGRRAFPRLRLRGVDTSELYTRAGQQARQFVEAELASCPAVVIATWRTDTYGRFLADVKYLAGERDPHLILAHGTYLNGRLLNEGLAVRYLD
jgi:endonuclease YncB( thermonuclease family)